MKKYKLLVLSGIAAIVIAVVVFGYREYNRKPASTQSLNADFNITAAQLMDQYRLDENAANARYLGKVLEVSGMVAGVNNEQDTLVNILLGEKEAMAHVSCSMSKESITDAKLLIPGTATIIRGVCTGFLMDVELNRCIVVK